MGTRPILFSAPMVRALLNDTKGQTRRVATMTVCGGRRVPVPADVDMKTATRWALPCPYGQPGDRLWVRETYRFGRGYDGVRPSEVAKCQNAIVQYEVDGALRTIGGRYLFGDGPFTPGKTRVSIHMPRQASRITLEITDIRAERLQDISEADAKAEGVQQSSAVEMADGSPCYSAEFRRLWESINGTGSWAANPLVWAITFRRITA